MNDPQYMKYVISLAQKAQGKTSPNPMVGAVVVKGNKIVAEGWHAFCGSDHAEIAALKKIGYKAKGATLYVNLEPCFHVGRTPPCVDTIIQSQIKRVVIGMKDPNPLTNGKSIQKLKKNGIVVTTDVLKEECERLNEHFIKYVTFKRPFVVAKSAQSLDGKIALKNGQSKWITSDKTRECARTKRDYFDAIMVGITTVLKDNPRLEAPGKRIVKIVIDSRLRIPPSSQLFKNTSKGQCLVATTKDAPLKKIQALLKKGICVLVDPSGRQRVNLSWLLKELADYQITSILMEGGAVLIASALKEKLVDKMHIYVAPKIIGEGGKSSVADLHVRDINKSLRLKDVSLEALDPDLFIEGILQYS